MIKWTFNMREWRPVEKETTTETEAKNSPSCDISEKDTRESHSEINSFFENLMSADTVYVVDADRENVRSIKVTTIRMTPSINGGEAMFSFNGEGFTYERGQIAFSFMDAARIILKSVEDEA